MSSSPGRTIWGGKWIVHDSYIMKHNPFVENYTAAGVDSETEYDILDVMGQKCHHIIINNNHASFKLLVRLSYNGTTWDADKTIPLEHGEVLVMDDCNIASVKIQTPTVGGGIGATCHILAW